MPFEFKPATRVGITPLIALYAQSGCGKTMSSLLMARGFVGSAGKIFLIDTESRRGEQFSDVIPGGYQVAQFSAPFSSLRYIEAWEDAVKFGAEIIVTDSMSHEHEGPGGMCDQAEENAERQGKSLGNWRKPKLEHEEMVRWMLRSPVPMIFCIRAKYKTRQKKDDKGKTVIVRDENVSPIQSEGFIFEMTAHLEVLQDHSVFLSKVGHPDLKKCFPEGTPITVEHGAMIAAWCKAPMGSTNTPKAKTRNQLLGELRDITGSLHGWSKDMGPGAWPPAKAALQKWLVDECAIDTLLDAQNDEQLAQTLVVVQNKLQKPLI